MDMVAVLEAFEHQVKWCEQLGSPFTSRILNVLADDIRAGGAVANLLSDFDEEPIAAALALRVAGAFHRRALEQSTLPLASLYPSVGGVGADALSDTALRSLLLDDLGNAPAHYRSYLESPPQTNEVGRSAVLFSGYLTIAHDTRLPFDIAEIGASAGLNLVFDQFSYDLGGLKIGPQGSNVHLSPKWRGEMPPRAEIVVRQRQACDIAPLDVTDGATRLRLLSYVWADQTERVSRIRGAMEIATKLGVTVEAVSADRFVERVLRERARDGVLVISHSVMWQYMPDDMRAHIQNMIEVEGGKATRDAPLAWLRFEPADLKGLPTLSLNLWDGGQHNGERRDLAVAHPHGSEVQWLL